MTHSAPILSTSSEVPKQVTNTDNTNRGPLLFVRKAALLRELEVGKSTLELWVATGHFPKPTALGPRTVAWPRSQVEEWKRARIATSEREGR